METKLDAPQILTNLSEDAQSPDIRELGDLQLALVGGGIGNVILG